MIMAAIDNNMRAAYVHVLADAATSLLAIVALACGYYFGLGFLDPVAALVGAFVIASWAYGLIRDSAMVLLDADADPKMSGAIRSTIEQDLGARVADLHLWRLGPGHQRLDRVAGLARSHHRRTDQGGAAPALSRPSPCDGGSGGLRRLRRETKKPPVKGRLLRNSCAQTRSGLSLLAADSPSRCMRLRCSLR